VREPDGADNHASPVLEVEDRRRVVLGYFVHFPDLSVKTPRDSYVLI
jgi:hypothetical protein